MFFMHPQKGPRPRHPEKFGSGRVFCLLIRPISYRHKTLLTLLKPKISSKPSK